MNKFRKSIIWKIIWIVGLIFLAYLSLMIENHFKELASDTFNPVPLIWTNSIIPFIFGIYISFLFMKSWSFNVDITLLCFVFIPSFLISFCYPILVMFDKWDISLSFIPFWLIRISDMEVFSIIAGISLILGVFNNPLRRDNT